MSNSEEMRKVLNRLNEWPFGKKTTTKTSFDDMDDEPEYDAWQKIEKTHSDIISAVDDFMNHSANVASEEESIEAYKITIDLLESMKQKLIKFAGF